MKVYTISDIHIDFKENRRWLSGLSQADYQNDILILPGDITDIDHLLIESFELLTKTFSKVLYVPGNHDVWVRRSNEVSSLDKFDRILTAADEFGIVTGPLTIGALTIVPLFAWYDYSFGEPSKQLTNGWSDYTACKWPEGISELELTRHFLDRNTQALNASNDFIISFSHFLPRIDLMPSFIPKDRQILYPVLGTSLLEEQIRKLKPNIHIYGHSHVNRQVMIDGIIYINNAFGYPYESRITRKELLCVYEL